MSNQTPEEELLPSPYPENEAVVQDDDEETL